MKMRADRRLKPVLLSCFGLALFGAVVYLQREHFREGWSQARFDPRWLATLLFTTLLTYFITVGRWSSICDTLARRKVCPRRMYLLYHLYGQFASQFLPFSGGDIVVKSVWLWRKHRLPLSLAIVSILVDRSFDILLFLTLLAPGLLYLTQAASGAEVVWLGSAAVVALAAGLVTLGPRLVAGLAWGMNRIAFVRSRAIEAGAESPNGDVGLGAALSRAARQRDHVALYVLLSVGRYAMLVVNAYGAARAASLEIPLSAFLVGIPIMQLGVFFAMIPAGLGVLEGGWFVILTASGVSPSHVALFMVEYRVYLLVYTNAIVLLVVIGNALIGATTRSIDQAGPLEP
jgi:uncharacterized membrane protein YbhN (UPF0104 family)